MHVAKAKELLEHGGILIDVRTIAEFNSKHVEGSINIPLDTLREEIERNFPDTTKSLLLYCRSGARSGIGADMLQTIGYKKAYNLGSYYQAALVRL